jgi:Ca2+-binding EF-hand superfamily protein
MNKPLLVLLCTLASGVALAQAVAPSASPDRAARRAEFQARAQARFSDSDRNHDGRISLAEFQDASDRQLAQRFHRLDANNDGQVTQDELRQAHALRREKMRDRRQARGGRGQALRALDTNGDRALDRVELGNRFPRLAAHFDQLDSNHDGRLTHDEMRAGRDRRQQAR